jgi:hypothetical protein
MGGIPFDDERVKGADWERRKADTPFGVFLADEQKKAQRKALVEGPLPFYLARLQQRLEA